MLSLFSRASYRLSHVKATADPSIILILATELQLSDFEAYIVINKLKMFDMMLGHPVISCGILPQQELKLIFQPEETNLQENSNLQEVTHQRDRKVQQKGQMKEWENISSPPALPNQPVLFRARARSVQYHCL